MTGKFQRLVFTTLGLSGCPQDSIVRL